MSKRKIDYLTVSSSDLQFFHKGIHCGVYNFLGAHCITNNGLKGVNFTLWAPNASRVNIVGDFNNWIGIDYPMKRIRESGIWNIFIPDLGEKEIYKYEIHTKDGEIILKSDPYAYYAELRPNTASMTIRLNKHKWNDDKWIARKKEKNLYKEPMNIYELHLGSWKRKEDGSLYNYREIADEIIEYIKELEYTHIELMPLSEHPFDGSWGYQITGYYCITSRYGAPEDFMYFVDKCHQNDIGVILDWVPAHFCKDSHGLYRFDGTELYEYANKVMGENIEWGTAVFDYSKNEVVNFLISNAMFWFDIYHIDGLRVDAVSYMIYLDHGKKDDNWLRNVNGGKENLEAIEFVKNLNKAVFSKFPNALMIAEESTAWPHVTSPIHLGGLGFNFKWNMGWMNDMLRYMEMDPIYRKWHHDLITFSFIYAFSENYILPFSHDEVVHGKKSLLSKMPGDCWQKFANLRVLFSYLIAHPGRKLLFMGGEFAQINEWDYYKSLDWMLLELDTHEKFNCFVKKLNSFYKNEKSLYQLDSDHRGFSWIDHQNYEESVIIFMRKEDDEEGFTIIVCNFTPVVRKNYRIGVPRQGKYEEVFNSDLEEFGGSGVENKAIITSQAQSWHNQPYSIEIEIPPLGALFLKLKTEKEDEIIEDIQYASLLESSITENNNHKNVSS